MVRAWFTQEAPENPQLENHVEPPEFVTLEKLKAVGATIDVIDPKHADTELMELAAQRKFATSDNCVVSPSLLADNWEARTRQFYSEHYHNDDEVRYVLEGSGYFDVRDGDRWIRIEATPGAMITLAGGTYHRFSCTPSRYISLRRFYRQNESWATNFRDAAAAHAAINAAARGAHASVAQTA